MTKRAADHANNNQPLRVWASGCLQKERRVMKWGRTMQAPERMMPLSSSLLSLSKTTLFAAAAAFSLPPPLPS